MKPLERAYIAKKILRPIVLRLLNLPEDDVDTVLIPYDSGPAPADRLHSYCYIHASPGSDTYGDQHHISAQDMNPASENLTFVDQYTEVHRVLFSCYGPKSDEWSTTIRNALFRRDISGELKKHHLFLRLPIQPIQWLPEQVGGWWWRRHDLSVTFFEAVRIEIPDSIPTIETFNMQPVTERKT